MKQSNIFNVPRNTQNALLLGCAFIIPVIIMMLPLEFIPIKDITQTQQRILAIFFLAAFLWIFEPIPNFSTSVLVIFLELVLTSNKGLIIFRNAPDVGLLLNYKTIFSSFASPIIILFIGGFALALAIQKNHIDYTLANILLKPFGNNPKIILLGLMLITALFSMFMSNTATTAMMISILMPVITALPREDRIRTAFALGVPFAANIGGIGTPIGTPPNAIALGFMPEDLKITFSKWMMVAVPFVIVLLLILWIFFILFFKTEVRTLAINNKEYNNASTRNKVIVYSTFGLTILLWMTDFIHGMNSYIVAMIPLVVFFITGVLKKADLEKFNWDVLWLVAGGIAMGIGMRDTGLAESIVTTFDLQYSPMIVIFIVSVIITYILSNFMSHTAASNLFFPILIAIVISNQGIVDSGYTYLIILTVVFTASLSMILPISTPPNALGYATGLFSTKQMAFFGILIGVIGIIISYAYLLFLVNIGIL